MINLLVFLQRAPDILKVFSNQSCNLLPPHLPHPDNPAGERERSFIN